MCGTNPGCASLGAVCCVEKCCGWQIHQTSADNKGDDLPMNNEGFRFDITALAPPGPMAAGADVLELAASPCRSAPGSARCGRRLPLRSCQRFPTPSRGCGDSFPVMTTPSVRMITDCNQRSIYHPFGR